MDTLAKQQRHKDQASQEYQEVLAKIARSINAVPDAACEIPQSDIEKYLTEQVNEHGLMDNVARTVFHRDLRPAQTPYEAQRARFDAETRRLAARNQATYKSLETGEQAPVGDQPIAEPPPYRAQLSDIKATSRIQNGLLCSANVMVDFLRFSVTYDFTLDDTQSDGWNAHLQAPTFTEEAALAGRPELSVAYGRSEIALSEARRQSEIDLAQRNADAAKAKQRQLADEAYRNSPAGRAAANAQTRALSADYKRRGLACQNSGGTWGFHSHGNTIMEVTPGVVPIGIVPLTLGCYHL